MRASQRKNLVPHGKASTILAATLFQDRLPAVARQLTVAPPLNSSGCPRSMRMRIHLLSVQPRLSMQELHALCMKHHNAINLISDPARPDYISDLC